MYKQITDDLTAAMKSGNKFELSVIRMLKSALKNEEINKKSELSDDEVINIIKKQVKLRREAKIEYEGYNRMDLADNLGKEIEILNRYLPAEMSTDDLTKIIDEVIKELEATDLKSMGAAMKAISAKVGSAADMSEVSRIVKEKLS